MEAPTDAEARLVIFAKAPLPGFCKTRLAAAIGEDAALEVHLHLLQYLIDGSKSLSMLRILCVTPDENAPEAHYWAPGMDAYYPQGEGDLGARLARAANREFASGAAKVLMVGTDCPHLGAKELTEAARALDDSPVVLGPAADGGYYLIGLRKPLEFLFRNISWSTSRVLSQTIDMLHSNGVEYQLLRELSDIDTKDDLHHIKDKGFLHKLGYSGT